jgi:hypothetical protein
MGRTACTEPQCLYKGDLYLYLYSSHNYVEIHLFVVNNIFSVIQYYINGGFNISCFVYECILFMSKNTDVSLL